MTTKELDLKLARDIARIRVANEVAAATKLPDTTLSAETVRAMDDLDAGREEDLIAELNTVLSDEKSMASVRTIISDGYIRLVQTKLGIHEKARLESKKGYAKFSAADRKKAIQSETTELSKAATLIKIAFESKAEEAVINAAAAEAYAYDVHKMLDAITHFLGIPVLGKEPINFHTELLTFTNGMQAAIEHLEKVQYYGTWIYERFQPIGIIRVTWSTASEKADPEGSHED
jgi:hypothetical protein